MKKLYLILIILGVLILGLFSFRFIFGGSEDSWILDSRGMYVKHGNPNNPPAYVTERQDAVGCAIELYDQKNTEGMSFSSQCLGTCGNYAVDIVHVPRIAEDNLIENQCDDYRAGKVRYFIELDKNGKIVRIG